MIPNIELLPPKTFVVPLPIILYTDMFHGLKRESRWGKAVSAMCHYITPRWRPLAPNRSIQELHQPPCSRTRRRLSAYPLASISTRAMSIRPLASASFTPSTTSFCAMTSVITSPSSRQ